MEAIESLKNLGLTAPESRCYLALSKLGAADAKQISADTQIKRTTVYALLENLAHKGFVQVNITGKRQLFSPVPARTVRLMYEKKLDHFNSLIPWLESLKTSSASPGGVRFMNTRKEVEQFYLAQIEKYKNKSYRIIGTERDWNKLNPEFLKRVHETLKQNKTRVQLLLSADTPKIANRATQTRLRDVRYLPMQYTFRTTIDIFDDAILLVSPELSSVAVVIAIPAMIDVFSAVFTMLWDKVGKK